MFDLMFGWHPHLSQSPIDLSCLFGAGRRHPALPSQSQLLSKVDIAGLLAWIPLHTPTTIGKANIRCAHAGRVEEPLIMQTGCSALQQGLNRAGPLPEANPHLNELHPHSGLKMMSPKEFWRQQNLLAQQS